MPTVCETKIAKPLLLSPAATLAGGIERRVLRLLVGAGHLGEDAEDLVLTSPSSRTCGRSTLLITNRSCSIKVPSMKCLIWPAQAHQLRGL